MRKSVFKKLILPLNSEKSVDHLIKKKREKKNLKQMKTFDNSGESTITEAYLLQRS